MVKDKELMRMEGGQGVLLCFEMRLELVADTAVNLGYDYL